MSFRFYFFLLFFTFLFMFYPGDNPHLQTIAFNKEAFTTQPPASSISIKPIPVVNPYAPSPTISAEGIYIINSDSMTPLYEKNPHMLFFPASTTKIITALVAFDLYAPEDVITIKNVHNEGQIMNLIPNERITAENLLYGMLVHSGNDAAYAMADSIGYDNFIKRMNEKAQSLHMVDSIFKNPAGLDENGQLTTPFDLALAARELLLNPYLRKIVGTKEIIISDVDYKIFHKLTNVNKLLGEIQGLGGLKTGYTESAGENLVSFYKYNEHDYIIVVMKSEDRFADTTILVDWIKNNITYASPLDTVQ